MFILPYGLIQKYDRRCDEVVGEIDSDPKY